MIEEVACVKCGFTSPPKFTYVPEFNPDGTWTGRREGHGEQLKITCSICGYYTFHECADAKGKGNG